MSQEDVDVICQEKMKRSMPFVLQMITAELEEEKQRRKNAEAEALSAKEANASYSDPAVADLHERIEKLKKLLRTIINAK